MTINAYAAMSARSELEAFSYEPGELQSHEVEIAVSHCGICHSDIHLIDNDWGNSTYPLVPGHEIVGTISALGSAARGLSLGQRVGVGWQNSTCLNCDWCLRGEEPACAESQPTCVGHHGGFAEAVRADSRFAFPIPEGLASEQVGPLFCGGATVYRPLREHATPQSRVGIIGVGGLGHMALQFANAFGCEVTAFSTSPHKKQEAKELGAHHFVLSTDAAQMKAAVGSLDMLLSTVTAPLDWNAWIGLLRRKGKMVIVGASPGTVDIPPMTFILKQISVIGSVIGGRATIRELLEFAERHNIRPQTETLPLSEVNTAIAKVRNNQVRYRMVLKNG